MHRYTGAWAKQYDTASDLILMGARPYDPSLGRFLAVDPVDGGSLNNYDYAGQDPINGYDLNGAMLENQEVDSGGCPQGSCGAAAVGDYQTASAGTIVQRLTGTSVGGLLHEIKTLAVACANGAGTAAAVTWVSGEGVIEGAVGGCVVGAAIEAVSQHDKLTGRGLEEWDREHTRQELNEKLGGTSIRIKATHENGMTKIVLEISHNEDP